MDWKKADTRQVIGMALLCLAISSPLLAADYEFTRIRVPGSEATFARGINARGDITGSYVDADGVLHGFLLREGVFYPIDVPDAAFTIGARSINARGDIVGSFASADGVLHGFLLRDGQFTQIDFPGASGSRALWINNADDIAGEYENAAGKLRGFLFKDGAFRRVHLPRSSATRVTSVQDSGSVLVGDTVRKSDGGLHGFILDGSGDFDLIDFPGLSVPCTFVRWINQRGEIVGFSAEVDTVEKCDLGAVFSGFLLRDGQYTRIEYPGATDTRALAINDDGVIVGEFTDPAGRLRGFMAVPVEETETPWGY